MHSAVFAFGINREKEVFSLLNSLGEMDSNDYSYVVISSWQQNKLNGNRRWHCLPIVSVDKESKTLQIINKRDNKVIPLTFDDLVNNFKAIVGFRHS